MRVSLYSSPPVSFLDVPLEIRRQIYQYCLVKKDPVDIHHIFADLFFSSDSLPRDNKKSLLLVSKQVGSEALEILYGKNVFQLYLHNGWGGHHLKGLFAGANIGRMRRMVFVIKPHRIDYGCMLDSTLWSPILAKLTKLSIVAQQPPQGPYHSSPTFEQVMEKWTEWLRAILQYIARQLSSSCIVEADDDDWKGTSTLMRENLPNGYRKVQTLAGDQIFRRKRCD